MRGATVIPQPVFNVDTVLANVAAERVSVSRPPDAVAVVFDHPSPSAYDLSTLRLSW